jgi:electron transport complex protein RnfG
MSGGAGNAGAMPTAPEAPPSWRLILTLGMAGLLSGLAIVGIYEITLPRITANKAAALNRAVFEVVPGSAGMQPLRWTGESLVVDPEASGEGVIYGAYDGEGTFLGYAIPGEGAGFQDNVKILYGYAPGEKKIVGMYVLESRETPGLGDRIFKDPDFVAEFKDLSVEPTVVLVKGTGTGPNEVDAITGATISSNAVVKILNGTNGTWLGRLPAPGGEPTLGPGGGGE